MDPNNEKKENNNQSNDAEFDNPYQDAPEMNEEIKLGDVNKSEPEKKEEKEEKEENKNLNANNEHGGNQFNEEFPQPPQNDSNQGNNNQMNNNQNNFDNNTNNNKNNSEFNPFENNENIDNTFGFPNEGNVNNNNNNNNNNFGFNANNNNNDNNNFPFETNNNNNNNLNPYRANDNNNSGFNPYRANNNNDNFKFNSNNVNNNNNNFGFNNNDNNNNNNYGFNPNNMNNNNNNNYGFNNNMNDNNNNNNFYRSKSVNINYNVNLNNYNNNYNNNNNFNNNFNNNYSINNNNNNNFNNNFNNNNNNNNNNYSCNNPNNSFNNNNYNDNNINNMFPSLQDINFNNGNNQPNNNLNDDDFYIEPEQPIIDVNKKKENKDKAIMENIIKVCDNKFKNAVAQFKNYQIVESKKNLKYIITSLNTLEQNIKNQKQFASYLIPNIQSLKTDVTKKFNEYNYFTYILEQNLLKNVQYQRGFDLSTFAEKFIIKRPYASFDDIFDTTLDPNKPTRNVLLNIFNDAQFSGYKSLFLYGPQGSGKTLYVHALASEVGAVLGQIDNLNVIKINYFVKEFARVITECTTKPIIIFVKNVDTMTRYALSEILFLHDKFNTEGRRVLFICSSPYPGRNLPYQLKFKYVQLINCVSLKNKYKLFKFLFNKFGINFQMNDNDLSNFVQQNFRNYSNRDVFYVVKSMMDIKKKNGENINNLGRTEMEQAMKMRFGTMDPQSMQYYYL